MADEQLLREIIEHLSNAAIELVIMRHGIEVDGAQARGEEGKGRASAERFPVGP